jgi:hypothetical protein
MSLLNRNKKKASDLNTFHPTLEALEDRCLPAPVAPLSPLPAGIAAVFTGEDVNNDGKTDLIEFTNDGRWIVSFNNSNSTVSDATTFNKPIIWADWFPASCWRQLFVGDFNGDGLTDVAGLSISGDWFVGLNASAPHGSPFPVLGPQEFVTGAPWANFGTGNSNVWTKLFVADFNGDGKDDIAGFGFNGKWFVGISQAPVGTKTESTFKVGTPWADFGTGNPNVWIQTFVGDFNGDGKADIAGFGFNGNWFVGLSNGTNTFSVGASWANWGSPSDWMDPGATQNTSLMGDSNVQTSASTGIRLYVGDFNGDGKTDIAGLGFNGNLFVGLSKGFAPFAHGIASPSFLDGGFATNVTPWANLGNPDNITALFIGNVNGDAGTAERDDIVVFNASAQWIVGISQSGVTGGSDSFQVNPNEFQDYERSANWVALAFGHNPINYNPTEELAHPAGYSTEFNSPGTTMDTQADIAALGFNLSWYAGISTPSVTPSQFRTGAVAVQW